jgi:hypothetical protein
MIGKRQIKLRRHLDLNSTHAQWVHTMRDSGSTRDDMITAWQNHMKSTPEAAALHVYYYLGNVGAEEILKHLTPKQPQSIELKEKVADSYWLKAHGEDAEFDILLKTPTVPGSIIQDMVANHQEVLCWMAHRNSHEATYNPHQLESGEIATSMLPEDIKRLLPFSVSFLHWPPE